MANLECFDQWDVLLRDKSNHNYEHSNENWIFTCVSAPSLSGLYFITNCLRDGEVAMDEYDVLNSRWKWSGKLENVIAFYRYRLIVPEYPVYVTKDAVNYVVRASCSGCRYGKNRLPYDASSKNPIRCLLIGEDVEVCGSCDKFTVKKEKEEEEKVEE